jgi:hypothetical protein
MNMDLVLSIAVIPLAVLSFWAFEMAFLSTRAIVRRVRTKKHGAAGKD